MRGSTCRVARAHMLQFNVGFLKYGQVAARRLSIHRRWGMLLEIRVISSGNGQKIRTAKLKTPGGFFAWMRLWFDLRKYSVVKN